MRRTSSRPVVLSVEQALSMSFATLRFVHQGFRVIRLEPTPVPGRPSKGDPNRSIGRPVAGADRHSYYVAPNVGKEAIAINLKEAQGRDLMHRLVRELPVDIFCTNTLPVRHAALGMDYETLRAQRADLIWCCISALGPGEPEAPGYDPMLQALCGYMDITGHPDGPPLQCGPPLIDLKAGDEAFIQTVLALAARTTTGRGRRIDISMAQVAVSWLQTFLPMLDMGSPPEELRRAGNEHRQFIPVNAYPARDGDIFVAVGSDAQWGRLVGQALFRPLDQEHFATNEGRRRRKTELHAAIAAITRRHTLVELDRALAAAGVPHSTITPIDRVMDLPFVRSAALSTVTPDGRVVRLPPPAVSTPYLEERDGRLPFAPAYGEHTDAVLEEAGLRAAEIETLRSLGTVA
jgi:itaconate CoA-transferase